MVKYLSSYIFEIRNRDIIPCATENIAVVDDNDSRILKFKIPAVIDDVDITDKILAIRYVNALGQFDTFFSDTREVTNDGEKRYIIFPWYLSQKATAASGTLTYDISIYDGRITDVAEEGQYILHTKPQVLNIEKGLLDVGSASQNPDVLTDAIATFQKIIGKYSNDAMNSAEAAKKSEDNAKDSEIKAESYKNAAAVSASNAAASEANANAYKDTAVASAGSARQSEINAHNYQIAAQNSAQAAATSEAKAKQSEQNAATSETNAEESANKANASQTASATSEANAKISEQNAKASENASKTSADDSASSASDSANSAQSSLNSQNAAKTSETKALASEKAAKQSETNAATSEHNASNYADNSQQSAEDAAASAAASLVSQNAAKASEDKAKASETNAASSAAEAATSEAHTKTSETNAAKSETNAKASENAAAASASAAKTSETNAKTSETNVANALVGTLKLSGGTMTGDITMSGDAKFVGNLTGNADTATSADSATNDSIGQQIDATYIKDLRPTGDKIIITKGNNETSTIDGAASKGYVLTETIPASTVTGQTWFHVGSISNTSDGDLIKIEINCPTVVSTENNSVAYSKNITLFIHDLAQTNSSDLSTAYIFSYIMYDDKLKSSDVDIENNSTKKEFFYLIPTSGGNGQSNAELWINTDSTFFNSIINVSLAKKDNWGYVLKYSANAPSVDQAITPYSKTSVVTDTNYATRTNAGIVQIGDNITVDNKGLISLIKDNVIAALGFTPANNSHTHNYAGSSYAGGSANSAVKLDTATAGSATKPVYISGGKPVACTHSLGKDVPANAVFTDHTYANMTAATASAAGEAGLVPAPPAGAQGKFLRGDGTWQAIASSGLSAYPVGSIYQSTDPTSPAALFGGSWVKIASERVLMGASSAHAAGTTVEAGLPNITGTLSDIMGTIWASPSGSGAFSGKYIGTSLENGNSGNYSNISFDASKSNAIYGRSSTVQPAAYYVHIWKRVG